MMGKPKETNMANNSQLFWSGSKTVSVTRHYAVEGKSVVAWYSFEGGFGQLKVRTMGKAEEFGLSGNRYHNSLTVHGIKISVSVHDYQASASIIHEAEDVALRVRGSAAEIIAKGISLIMDWASEDVAVASPNG